MDPLEAPWRHAAEHDELVLLLVRHGQTSWNATRRFLGQTDIGLDAIGQEQARRAALRLTRPLAGVYASPLSRALDTARALHADPVVLPGLAELHQGELEGLDGATAIQRFPTFFEAWMDDPERVRVPGGEGLGDLRDRVSHALGLIAARHQPGQVVGVFTHQMVIATMTCVARGLPLRAWRDQRVGNTHATALAWTPDGPRVIVQRLPLGEDPVHA